MRNTIKAKVGYTVHKGTLKSDVPFKGEFYMRYADDGVTLKQYRFISDGDELLVICDRRKWEDYLDEAVAGENECARVMEVFEDINGRQWIYWVDLEYDLGGDYVTLVPKDEEKVKADLKEARARYNREIDD